MSLMLETALNELLLSTPATILLQSGINAQLTRQEYYTPYVADVNPQLYVPIFYFNTVTGQVTIGNTQDLSFTMNDLYTANDWIVLNQIIYNFTADLVLGSATITNASITSTAGEFISGYGIPLGTTVVSGSAGTYILSNPVTITETHVTLYMTTSPST